MSGCPCAAPTRKFCTFPGDSSPWTIPAVAPVAKLKRTAPGMVVCAGAIVGGIVVDAGAEVGETALGKAVAAGASVAVAMTTIEVLLGAKVGKMS